MEQLIREGRLARYIASQLSLIKRRASLIRENERRNPWAQRISEPNRNLEDREEMETIIRTINVIARNFTGGRTTKLTWKKHLQEVLSLSTTKMRRSQAIIYS